MPLRAASTSANACSDARRPGLAPAGLLRLRLLLARLLGRGRFARCFLGGGGLLCRLLGDLGGLLAGCFFGGLLARLLRSGFRRRWLGCFLLARLLRRFGRCG